MRSSFAHRQDNWLSYLGRSVAALRSLSEALAASEDSRLANRLSCDRTHFLTRIEAEGSTD